MSFLEKLKGVVTFEHVERRRGSSKVNQDKKRRDKFEAYLNGQLKVLKNPPTKGAKKSVRIDFWEQDGKFIFEPRFGSRRVVIYPDDPDAKMSATSREGLEEAIGFLIAGVKDGELDEALAKAAEKAPRTTKVVPDQTQGEQPASKPKRAAKD